MVDFVQAALNDLSPAALRRLVRELEDDRQRLERQAAYLEASEAAARSARLPRRKPSRSEMKDIGRTVRNMWIVRQARAGKLNREIADRVKLHPAHVSRIVQAAIRAGAAEPVDLASAESLADMLEAEMERRQQIADAQIGVRTPLPLRNY